MSIVRRALLLSGLLTPFLYLVPSLVFGLYYPGYDPVAMHASVLGAADSPVAAAYNWFPKVHGFTIIAVAIGAIWTLLIWRRPVIGALLLLVFGAAMTSNGVVPMGSPWHGLMGLGILWLGAPAILALDLGDRLTTKFFRGFAVFTVVQGVLYLWLMFGHDPAGYEGLTQRLFGTAAYSWIAYIGWYLAQERPQAADR